MFFIHAYMSEIIVFTKFKYPETTTGPDLHAYKIKQRAKI